MARQAQPDQFQDSLFELDVPQDYETELADIRAQIARTSAIEELTPLVRRSRQLHKLARQVASGTVELDSDKETPAPQEAETISPTKEQKKRSNFTGGAFSSGLKRWVEQGQEKVGETKPAAHDLALLRPRSISQQLRPS